VLALAGAASLVVAGCGGGSRQDEDEPEGNFPVEVVSATFPEEQKLAKDSKMEIVVRNAGTKEIPVISVTVECPGQKGKADQNDRSAGSGGSPSGAGSQGGGFNYRSTFPGVADPSRPQFVVNTIPTRTPRNYDRGRLDPLERSSSYVSTFPLGKLAPNREARFLWDVTAVRAGPYRICWRVNAGLDGKAKAKPSGGPITGEFRGEVSNVAPDARIGDDGRTVIESEPQSDDPDGE
jgi:hypothetical protein